MYDEYGGLTGNVAHGGYGGPSRTGIYDEYGVPTGNVAHGGYGAPSVYGGPSAYGGPGGYGGPSGTGGQSGTVGPDPGSAKDSLELDPDRRGGGVSGNAVWAQYGRSALHPGKGGLKRRNEEIRQWEDENRR